jgi:hypothetical protein
MFMLDLQPSIAPFRYGSGGTAFLIIPRAVQNGISLTALPMSVPTPSRVSTFVHGHFTGVLPKPGAAFP